MRLGVLATAVALAVTQVSGAKDLAIFISADMEGVAGAATFEGQIAKGADYERFRGVMTGEVNAAIHAAKAAGATRIVVADSHGHNLLLDELPKDVEVVFSWPRPLGISQGIETGDFDAAIFIGFHTASGNPRGVMAHTWSGGSGFTSVRINGQRISEVGVGAAIAGQFGVPTIMVSGDDALVKESREMLGDIEGAIVKWAYGNDSIRTMTPAAAQELISAKVTKAIGRLGSFRPFRLEGPLTLEISMGRADKAEMLSYVPGVERVDSHTIRYVAADIIAVQRFFYIAGAFQ